MGEIGLEISKQKRIITFYDAAVKTASENSAAKEVYPARSGIVEVDVTAVSGTTPVLRVFVETSPDNVTWFHCASVSEKERQGNLTRLTAPVTGAGINDVRKVVAWVENLSRYVRLALTITGTTPSFTFSSKVTLYA